MSPSRPQYCSRQGIHLGAVKFLLRGERIFGASTPQELQVGCGALCQLHPAGNHARSQHGQAHADSQHGQASTAREAPLPPDRQLAPFPLQLCSFPPTTLQMYDGDELIAVPESSDRLQQQRELGPLFSAVFGEEAAARTNPLPEPVWHDQRC